MVDMATVKLCCRCRNRPRVHKSYCGSCEAERQAMYRSTRKGFPLGKMREQISAERRGREAEKRGRLARELRALCSAGLFA